MNMIYLLTGAAGFLGSNICQQLLERGDRVRAFVLQGDPAVKYIPAGVTIFAKKRTAAGFLMWTKTRKQYAFTALQW